MNIGLIIMSTASKTEAMKTKKQFISDVVELQVVFEGEAFDSSSIDLDTLFARVKESGKIPLTSQPTPYEIGEAINNGFKKFDHLLIVTPHSEISGTYQNCINVKNEHPNSDKIAVFQANGGIAITEALLIDRGLELCEAGTDFAEAVDILTEYNNRLTIYTFPGDFEYLKVSGRVKGATALILNALNIRVVIKMTGGEPIIDNKGRGEKSVLKYIQKELGNGNVEKIYYTPIQDNPKMRVAVLNLLADLGLEPEITEEANSVPGAHLGPNNFGLGVVYKK